MSPLIVICALVSGVCTLKVQTSQGAIRGLETETPFGRVHSFLGIPYAQPPVGPLRFKPPVPPVYSENVYNATEKRSSCPAIDMDLGEVGRIDFGKQDEDCLFLNIWAPADASNLPIVLYVHGGMFAIGSGSFFGFDGTHLAARANVVYMTVNMRLGPFGFLHLPDMPDTNVGLLDLVRALQWIRTNAKSFGGDPEQVTVWGQSAGAMATDFLLNSDAVHGLVRRAIYQGGASGTANFLFKLDGQYASQQLAYAVGCSDERSSTEELLSCLRNVPWQEIIAKINGTNIVEKASIQPFVDHKLLRSDVLSSPRIDSSVREIFVLNDELEAFTFMEYLLKQLYLVERISSTDWTTGVLVTYKMILQLPYRVTRGLLEKYVPSDMIGAEGLDDLREIELQKCLGQMFTDPMFFCPSERRAETASDRGVRVYRGEFHFRPGFSFLPEWASMTHGEEIPYLHGNLYRYSPHLKEMTGKVTDGYANITDSDRKFSDTMIDLFRDFFHGRVTIHARKLPFQ